MAHELQVLSFVISPQATATSVLKIIVSAICVSFGYTAVTALKEGPLATYEDRTELGSLEMPYCSSLAAQEPYVLLGDFHCL